jgi:hypothetical protein
MQKSINTCVENEQDEEPIPTDEWKCPKLASCSLVWSGKCPVIIIWDERSCRLWVVTLCDLAVTTEKCIPECTEFCIAFLCSLYIPCANLICCRHCAAWKVSNFWKFRRYCFCWVWPGKKCREAYFSFYRTEPGTAESHWSSGSSPSFPEIWLPEELRQATTGVESMPHNTTFLFGLRQALLLLFTLFMLPPAVSLKHILPGLHDVARIRGGSSPRGSRVWPSTRKKHQKSGGKEMSPGLHATTNSTSTMHLAASMRYCVVKLYWRTSLLTFSWFLSGNKQRNRKARLRTRKSAPCQDTLRSGIPSTCPCGWPIWGFQTSFQYLWNIRWADTTPWATFLRCLRWMETACWLCFRESAS